MSESFQMAKDAGFKVVAHMMPDLPNVDMDRDILQFIVSAASHLPCAPVVGFVLVIRENSPFHEVLDQRNLFHFLCHSS